MESNNINNTDILKKNLELAIQTYMLTTVPAEEELYIYMKGSIRTFPVIFAYILERVQEVLKQSHPEVYQHFSDVWSVRQRHLVHGYPSQYVYYTLESTCIHPLCWFRPQPVQGGPSVCTIPMPIHDPTRPWGGTCSDCKQFCAGHSSSLRWCYKLRVLVSIHLHLL